MFEITRKEFVEAMAGMEQQIKELRELVRRDRRIAAEKRTALGKRLDELERMQDHKHNQWTGKPQYLKPDPPPERPEPKFKVGDLVRFLTTEDPWKIADIKDSLAMDEQRGRWRPISMLQPATPPECLCDERRREEEAGMIHLRKGHSGMSYGGGYYSRTCIHCNLPIKSSLLEE